MYNENVYMRLKYLQNLTELFQVIKILELKIISAFVFELLNNVGAFFDRYGLTANPLTWIDVFNLK